MKKKYDQISDGLRRKIAAGEYRTKLPSLRALAREFKADFKTVRKALDQLVRENVIQARERSGLYLAAGQHVSIGIICGRRQESFFEDDYYQAVCRGVLDVISEKGDVFSYQEKGARRYRQLFKNHSTVDAFLVFTPGHESLAELNELNIGLPVVVIGRDCKGTALNSVVSDDLRDSAAGVALLLRQGHRRIAYIGTTPHSQTHQLRLQGYQRTLKAHRLAYDPAYVVLDSQDNSRFEAEVLELFALDRGITAVFGADRTPMLKALAVIGPRIKKLDLVVYDDFHNMFKQFKAHYHAIEQPLFETGQTAVRLAYQLLQGPARPPAHLVFRSQLIAK